MHKLIKIFFILICLLLPIIAYGDNGGSGSDENDDSSTESPEAIAERLQSRYDKIGSLSFNFIQIL